LSTTFSIQDGPSISPKRCSKGVARRGSGPAFSSTSRFRAWHQSCPIFSVSAVPRFSWWAMAWISPIAFASFPLSPRGGGLPEASERRNQALKIIEFDGRARGIAEAATKLIENLACALNIDRIRNLHRQAEVGPARAVRASDRIAAVIARSLP